MAQVFLQLILVFSINAYNSNNKNINNDDQVARASQIQIFTNQFKCVTHQKFRGFVLKVATTGPHLILIELNAITLPIINCLYQL